MDAIRYNVAMGIIALAIIAIICYLISLYVWQFIFLIIITTICALLVNISSLFHRDGVKKSKTSAIAREIENAYAIAVKIRQSIKREYPSTPMPQEVKKAYDVCNKIIHWGDNSSDPLPEHLCRIIIELERSYSYNKNTHIMNQRGRGEVIGKGYHKSKNNWNNGNGNSRNRSRSAGRRRSPGTPHAHSRLGMRPSGAILYVVTCIALLSQGNSLCVRQSCLRQPMQLQSTSSLNKELTLSEAQSLHPSTTNGLLSVRNTYVQLMLRTCPNLSCTPSKGKKSKYNDHDGDGIHHENDDAYCSMGPIYYEDNSMAILFKPAGIHSLSYTNENGQFVPGFDKILPLILKKEKEKTTKIDRHESNENGSLDDPVDNNPTSTTSLSMPCHRLDARVCGLLVIAKTSLALKCINRQFRQREVKKYYRALVIDSECRGRDTYQLGESSLMDSNDKNMVIIDSPIDAKPSITRISTLDSVPSIDYNSLHDLLLEPITGRRHQLRIHCSNILKMPIIGDDLYMKTRNEGAMGERENGTKMKYASGPLYLQCTGVSLRHPILNTMIEIETDVIERFSKLKQKTKKRYDLETMKRMNVL